MSVTIRLKRDHSVVETVDWAGSGMPPVSIGCGWWKRCDAEGKAIFYSDSHWEPVTFERWEDVANECMVIVGRDDDAWASIAHNGRFIATFKSGYRLRKELVDFPASQDQQERRCWAFIVKRLVKL